jgi:hypothetical protein
MEGRWGEQEERRRMRALLVAAYCTVCVEGRSLLKEHSVGGWGTGWAGEGA